MVALLKLTDIQHPSSGIINLTINADGSVTMPGALGITGAITTNVTSGLLKTSAGVIDAAVSGTDIKTINSISVLGSGNILIRAGISPQAYFLGQF